MAWNDIPAAEDDQLSIQAYYVRLNALHQFLSPLASKMLEAAWDSDLSETMQSFRRSAVIGMIASDLIRGLGLPEVTERRPAIGDWFVHSGITSYAPLGDVNQLATILLPGGDKILATVRPECRITNTAAVNMAEQDDVSLVVGRLLSPNKFDLVVAGCRDPKSHMRMRIPLQPTVGDSMIDRLAPVNPFPNVLPTVRIDSAPNYAVLAHAVKDTVERFAEAVEKQGAWRHLYNQDDRPAHETRHQGLFRLFSQLAFGALRISVHPNADHGVGATDLTLNLDNDTHVLEFKKDTSIARVLHGLQEQLPRYLDAANTVFGSYVIMCHERNVREVSEIVRSAVVKNHVIETYIVDCRRQSSASKFRG